MTSADPSFHRRAEQRFIEHVARLLADHRLKIETTRGKRALSAGPFKLTRNDQAVEVKRLMSEMGVPDRELQAKMPVGAALEVELKKNRFFLFPTTIGRIK